MDPSRTTGLQNTITKWNGGFFPELELKLVSDVVNTVWIRCGPALLALPFGSESLNPFRSPIFFVLLNPTRIGLTPVPHKRGTRNELELRDYLILLASGSRRLTLPNLVPPTPCARATSKTRVLRFTSCLANGCNGVPIVRRRPSPSWCWRCPR
jgi:hypothetical protein